ncbi:MAG: large subunit ribosomal protein [Patescibacteria group bacterium]|nr:large subunit ribosomal protein [Patescibacteria group bacterium]
MANTFKGRKFGRKRDEREALLAGLSTQLILNHSIRTTLGKAKELRPHVEKLVTLAKKGTLSSRRLAIARMDNNVEAGHYLVDVIVPSVSGRTSGYLRISKEGNRRGDNAEMARISFVDEIKQTSAPLKVVKKAKEVPAKKPSVKAPVKKVAPKKATAKKVSTK